MANNSHLVIFVDTSLFKALVDQQDEFHDKAEKIWNNLDKERTLLATSNFIIDESLTLIRVRCGLKKALSFREKIIKGVPVLKLIRVTVVDEAQAWNWFLNEWKDLSFTDCVSFSVMKRLGIQKVLTFDKHFTQAGFERME